MSAASDWLVWLGSLGLMALLAVLVFVAWWALFADRARGRRRCPRCWYDLSGTSGMTCPECGHTARAERDFGRTRRRRGLALLAILGCTATSLYVIDRANVRGWMSYLPTPILIWTVPVVDNPAGMVMGELEGRMRAGQLDDEQWLALLERCCAGDRGARPPGDEWLAKYSRLMGFCRWRMRREPRPPWLEQAEALMFSIPLRIELATRPHWPAEIGPTIDVVVRDWWPADAQVRIRAEPDLPGAIPDIHVRRDAPIQPRSYSLHLPPLPAAPDKREVAIELTVERRRTEEEPWRQIDRRVQTVELAAHEPTLLEPTRSDEMDTAIAEVFTRRPLVRWPEGSLPVRIGLDARPTLIEPFADTAVAVRVEVLRNGELGRQLDIWWMAGPGGSGQDVAWEVPMWNDALLGAPARPDDEWALRIAGRRDLALRVPGATRYWSGEVVVPTAVRDNTGAAPARGWVPDEKELRD